MRLQSNYLHGQRFLLVESEFARSIQRLQKSYTPCTNNLDTMLVAPTVPIKLEKFQAPHDMQPVSVVSQNLIDGKLA